MGSRAKFRRLGPQLSLTRVDDPLAFVASGFIWDKRSDPRQVVPATTRECARRVATGVGFSIFYQDYLDKAGKISFVSADGSLAAPQVPHPHIPLGNLLNPLRGPGRDLP